MQFVASINESDVEFSTYDDSVNAITFWNNKNIFYLPVKTGEKFPNLAIYWAQNCSINDISKLNFVGLSKLERLYLGKNAIERLPATHFLT